MSVILQEIPVFTPSKFNAWLRTPEDHFAVTV
jgi:hypothetical protein